MFAKHLSIDANTIQYGNSRFLTNFNPVIFFNPSIKEKLGPILSTPLSNI